MSGKKEALAYVVKKPIVIPKTPITIFILKCLGIDIYGIDKFYTNKYRTITKNEEGNI